jgi:transposase-like protein
MKMGVEARVREGVNTVLEVVLQDEMREHCKFGYREFAPTR